MYSKIAGTIGALGNLEIRAITLGKICVYECLSWSPMKNIVKRNILVSNHDEHVEDNIKSINNEFKCKQLPWRCGTYFW
jgi:hypothetical protein